MEEQLAAFEMRNDELWGLLSDPELPPLDRQSLNEEMEDLHNQIMELERRLLGFEVVYWLGDDDDSTITYSDEYDREGLIANEDFDFVDEI